MARILYGLCGVGRGHNSRSAVIINRLLESGHDVRIVTWGNGHELLPRHFRIETINGWNFSLNSNGLDYFRTAASNVLDFMGNSMKTVKKVADIVSDFKPQVGISDMEPYVSGVSNLRNIPVISLDHGHIISACKMEYPENWSAQYHLADTFCKTVAMNARHFFITSFYFPELRGNMKHKTTLVGPILRPEILCQRPKDNKHLVVYLSNTSSRDAILPVLQKLDMDVIAYGFPDSPSRKGNITFKAPGVREFVNDLAGCTAVIANAGYNLICEALYLQKPVYTIPINGQFEQMANAHYLQKMQYGIYDFQPTTERIGIFLDNLSVYKRNIAACKADFSANNSLQALLKDKIREVIRDSRIKSKYRRSVNFLPGIARSILNNG
jgi:uncharacterized protein (TIGR00661 family)